MTDLYKLSQDWCVESAKSRRLRYVANIEGGEKYFRSKDEAQEYFNDCIPKPYTQAILTYSNGDEFTVIEVRYQ